jgi:SAM-dependent methyltransferase
MTPHFSIHILHNPRRPERVKSLTRLTKAVGGFPAIHDDPGSDAQFNEYRWEWAIGCTQDSHAVFLDDDVEVCPNFREAVAKVIAAKPGEVIGLHAIHPQCALAGRAGEQWVTSDDATYGPAMIIPIPVLREFLEWRRAALKPEEVARGGPQGNVGSDVLVGLFCMESGRKVWHPVPTLTDQDASIPSNFGHDADDGTKRTVWNWRHAPIPDSYEQTTPVRHVGGVFAFMPHVRETFLKDQSRKVAANAAASPHVFIALPCYGGIEPGFFMAFTSLVQELVKARVGVNVSPLPGESLITRGRNRLAYRFYEGKPEATGMLFLDVDLDFDPGAVVDMILSGLDVVAAPYPVKSPDGRLVCTPMRLKDARTGDVLPVKLTTATYADGHKREFALAHDVPTGCLYISRRAFDAMAPLVARYECEIEPGRPTCHAFFDTGTEKQANGKLRYLSEDYGFARLCQMAGLECWLDMDAKLGHTGKYRFTGLSLRETWEKEKAESRSGSSSEGAAPPASRSTDHSEASEERRIIGAHSDPPNPASRRPEASAGAGNSYGLALVAQQDWQRQAAAQAQEHQLRYGGQLSSAQLQAEAARVERAWQTSVGPAITETGVWTGDSKVIADHHACDMGLANWLADYLDPERQVYDLGCGLGTYLSVLRQCGFKFLIGYDGEVNPRRDFGTVFQQDLTKPFSVKPGDVICLEVAEHIPARFEGVFLDNVCGAVERGGRLVLSWATRGQGGHGHVNERNNPEVIRLLDDRGFDYLEAGSFAARRAVSALDWFRHSTMCFRRRP